MLKRAGLIAMLCVGRLVAGCGDDSSDDSTADGGTTATTTESAPPPADASTGTKPEVAVPDGPPPNKLVKKDLVQGSGPAAKAGDEVSVHYVGVGYESGEQFDASWDRGEPLPPFTLGTNAVIKGWEEGVVGMKVGGRRELTIPPDLAYGPAGAPPAIGPNETLIFVVDLVAIK